MTRSIKTARVIKMLREKPSMTQAEIAKACGVSQPYVFQLNKDMGIRATAGIKLTQSGRSEAEALAIADLQEQVAIYDASERRGVLEGYIRAAAEMLRQTHGGDIACDTLTAARQTIRERKKARNAA